MRITYLILLIFFGNAIDFYAQTNNFKWNTRNNLVKIQTPSMENGTGSIIGYDNEYIYILTADHIFYDSGSNDLIDIYVEESSSERNETKTNYKIYKADIHLRISNRENDIAILRISVEILSNSKYNKQNKYGLSYIIIGRDSLDLCNSTIATFLGFPGGTIKKPDFVEQTIRAPNYYNRSNFFRIGAEGIETGHSGSLVRNSNHEIIGMLIKINEQATAAQVMKFECITNCLIENDIPINLVKNSKLIGDWYIEGFYFPNNRNITYSDNQKIITFLNNGTVQGLINGKFCMAEGKINLFLTEYVSVEVPNPSGNGFYSVYHPFNNHTGFNYEFSTITPVNFTTGKVGSPPLILTSNGTRIVLYKVK